MFEDVERVRLEVWKLRTPRPRTEIEQEGYIPKLKCLQNPEEEEDEDEVKKNKAKGKAVEMAKAKKEEVAWRLQPNGKISSYLEVSWHDTRIRVLIQAPTKAGVGNAADDTNSGCFLRISPAPAQYI